MTSIVDKPFKSMKAKKRRYGFSMSGPHGPDAIVKLAGIIQEVRRIDSDVLFDWDNSYGKMDFKIYSDNDTLAAYMERENCWNTDEQSS